MIAIIYTDAIKFIIVFASIPYFGSDKNKTIEFLFALRGT